MGQHLCLPTARMYILVGQTFHVDRIIVMLFVGQKILLGGLVEALALCLLKPPQFVHIRRSFVRLSPHQSCTKNPDLRVIFSLAECLHYVHTQMSVYVYLREVVAQYR